MAVQYNGRWESDRKMVGWRGRKEKDNCKKDN